jgi:hypothetical protein
MSRITVRITGLATVFEIQEFGFQGARDHLRTVTIPHDPAIRLGGPQKEYTLKYWIPQRQEWVGFLRTQGHFEGDNYGCEDSICGPFSVAESSPTEELPLPEDGVIHEEW